jgi:hypothetical protein
MARNNVAMGECPKGWASHDFATENTEISEKKTQSALRALWLSPRN